MPKGNGKAPRVRARVRGQHGTGEKEGQRAKTPLEKGRTACLALRFPGNSVKATVSVPVPPDGQP